MAAAPSLTGSWSIPVQDPAVPECWGGSLCSYKGKAYGFGGYGRLRNGAELLTIDTQHWRFSRVRTAGESPPCNDSHTATLLGCHIVVFGGTDGDHKYNQVHMCNLETLQWTAVSLAGQPPSPREGHIAVPLTAQHILIFGGAGYLPQPATQQAAPEAQDVFCYLNDVHVLNLKDKTWQGVAVQPDSPLPAGRDSHAGVLLGKRVVLYGGDCGDAGYTDDVWAFELQSRSWHRLEVVGTAAPGARAGHSAAAVLDDAGRPAMLVVGGVGMGDVYCGDAWLLRLGPDPGLGLAAGQAAWSPLSTKGAGPSGRFAHSACLLEEGNAFLLLGGADGAEKPLNDVHLLTLDWLPQRRSPTANGTVAGGRLAAAGVAAAASAAHPTPAAEPAAHAAAPAPRVPLAARSPASVAPAAHISVPATSATAPAVASPALSAPAVTAAGAAAPSPAPRASTSSAPATSAPAVSTSASAACNPASPVPASTASASAAATPAASTPAPVTSTLADPAPASAMSAGAAQTFAASAPAPAASTPTSLAPASTVSAGRAPTPAASAPAPVNCTPSDSAAASTASAGGAPSLAAAAPAPATSTPAQSAPASTVSAGGAAAAPATSVPASTALAAAAQPATSLSSTLQGYRAGRGWSAEEIARVTSGAAASTSGAPPAAAPVTLETAPAAAAPAPATARTTTAPAASVGITARTTAAPAAPLMRMVAHPSITVTTNVAAPPPAPAPIPTYTEAPPPVKIHIAGAPAGQDTVIIDLTNTQDSDPKAAPPATTVAVSPFAVFCNHILKEQDLQPNDIPTMKKLFPSMQRSWELLTSEQRAPFVASAAQQQATLQAAAATAATGHSAGAAAQPAQHAGGVQIPRSRAQPSYRRGQSMPQSAAAIATPTAGSGQDYPVRQRPPPAHQSAEARPATAGVASAPSASATPAARQHAGKRSAAVEPTRSASPAKRHHTTPAAPALPSRVAPSQHPQLVPQLAQQPPLQPTAATQPMCYRANQQLLGASVEGVVDGSFDVGYTATVRVNGFTYKAVLFSPFMALAPPQPSPAVMHPAPAMLPQSGLQAISPSIGNAHAPQLQSVPAAFAASTGPTSPSMTVQPGTLYNQMQQQSHPTAAPAAFSSGLHAMAQPPGATSRYGLVGHGMVHSAPPSLPAVDNVDTLLQWP